MRRHRISRPRKMRPSVTVKTKLAPREGKCTACAARILKGEEAVYVRTRVRRYHKTCAPANVYTPTSPVQPTLPTNPVEANLVALEALENAVVVKAKMTGITDELEKAFATYQKCKAVALRPGTPGEERAAMRMAVLAIVKIVF